MMMLFFNYVDYILRCAHAAWSRDYNANKWDFYEKIWRYLCGQEDRIEENAVRG